MDTELKDIPSHMLKLGLGALKHAIWHANYSSEENEMWSELSVIQAAHAAEILIKARIAQEHPLLIFEQIPKSGKVSKDKLGFHDLIENGRTYQYTDLPERLWASTGIKLPNLELYKKFGYLRNAIQHFTNPTDRYLSFEVLEFIFAVVDPFINACWKLYAIDYNEDHEPYIYLIESLVAKGIPFLVSQDAVKDLKFVKLDWPSRNVTFKRLMQKRFKEAAL